MRSAAYAPMRRIVSALVSAGLLSCGEGTVATEPVRDPNQLYWALTLDHHAVTLAAAPGFDTLTVTATPRSPDGTPLQGLGPVTYTSTDLTRLRVSSEGVLQAVAPGSRIVVLAKLQAQQLTHVDTVFVDVTAEPPARPLASLSIHPVPPDSAKVGNGGGKLIEPYVTDVDGNRVYGLLVEFVSLDSTIARVGRLTGELGPQGRVGDARIVASATAYGVRFADTVTYRIGLPISALVFVRPGKDIGAQTVSAYEPSGVRIAVGATVLWWYTPDIAATDVTFEDPTNVAESLTGINGIGAMTGAGNISAPTGCTAANPGGLFTECVRGRAFPVPGVYRFRSTLTGAEGQIIVEAED